MRHQGQATGQGRDTVRLAIAALGFMAVLAGNAQAAYVEGTNGDDLLFGHDDENAQIQPQGAVNQSLDNADVIDGGNGDDVLVGLLGSDIMRGGKGNDIIVGGTE